MAELLSPDQIAAELAVSRTTAYALIKTMPRVQVGRLVRVERGAFEA